jgi:hypothetical protein
MDDIGRVRELGAAGHQCEPPVFEIRGG